MTFRHDWSFRHNWSLFAKSSWWGNFATLGTFKAPNCLTHTLTCKPMLRSEADRFANQVATESSISSQHLKESAVPSNCPKTMGPQYAVPLASSVPHQQHQVSPRENVATFLKDETFPTKLSTPQVFPHAVNL